MAKTSIKTAKAAPKLPIEDAEQSPAKPTVIKPPKAAAKTTTKSVAKPAAKLPAAKPSKPAAPAKAKKAAGKPLTVTRLASEILADRIMPTIDQIKAIALHALGQSPKKNMKPKAKKN